MVRLLAFTVIALAACGDDEIIPPAELVPDATPVADATPATFDAAPPPAAFRAEGTATGDGAGNDRVECTLFLDIVDVAATADGWSGTGSGEVIRRSFDGPDLTFEFSALVGGEVSLAATDGTVEARLVGDQPDDAAPFWLSLEVISGDETAAFTYGGAWTCSPILPDDPETGDLDVEAPGTWTIAPAT